MSEEYAYLSTLNFNKTSESLAVNDGPVSKQLLRDEFPHVFELQF